MDERILKWLFDVKMSIDEIDAFFENKQKNFFDYRTNIMLKRAVERNLEIIGEAINRIITRDKLFTEKITNAKAIGMTKIAEKSGLSRPSLYKALSEGSKPQFSTILKVLGAVGGKVNIEPIAI